MDQTAFEKACDEITSQIEQMSPDGNCIVVDGVINPENYIKATPKILWILKEANDNSGGEGWSYLENFQSDRWLNVQKCASISTIKRVAYVSYGLLYSGDAQWSEFPMYYDAEC